MDEYMLKTGRKGIFDNNILGLQWLNSRKVAETEIDKGNEGVPDNLLKLIQCSRNIF